MKISFINIIVIIIIIINLQISTIQCVKYPITNTNNEKNDQLIKRGESKMIFAVTCVSNDTIYCGKIVKSFNTIGKILSSVILFREPLLVNVTIEQDCIPGEIDCIQDVNLIGKLNSLEKFYEKKKKKFTLKNSLENFMKKKSINS